MVVTTAVEGIVGYTYFGSFSGGVLLMAATLSLVWNILLGGTMYIFRNSIRRFVERVAWNPQTTFVVFATTLALTEEAITTSLTNLAPLFGNNGAFITASNNYLEVVLYHSVIVFVPMFFVWAWVLTRYRFSPAAVFLLFGINGIVAEAFIGGVVNATLGAPFWIFVYGLMVFLPAYSFPREKFPKARQPCWYMYLLVVVGCFVASAIVAGVVSLSALHLPHFSTTLLPPQ